MTNCEACGAPLETLVACAACSAVRAVPDVATPFAVLGLEPPRFDVDEPDLRRRRTRASRLVHPDFFGAAAPDARERAERNSALLNRAYDVLADPARRADWLVLHLGGPSEESDRAMAPDFLAEVLDWNEVLEEARASDRLDPRVEPLAADLARRREEGLARLARLLVPTPARGAPALAAARRELNALRYLDRALREIESQRLARAERR